MNPKIYIVIPAYNEASRLGRVLTQLKFLNYDDIVVVDDGSDDDTRRLASTYGVGVVCHPINMGVGAATQTGITYALKQGADYIVTIDADYQHKPEDISLLVDSIIEHESDLVIGSRFLNKENSIPISRVVFNKIANIIAYFITGIYVTDSQSGMKVFSRRFAAARTLNCVGFEFCVEMIRNARRLQGKVSEVPIRVTYSADTMKKGQSFWTGLKMIGRLIKLNFFG